MIFLGLFLWGLALFVIYAAKSEKRASMPVERSADERSEDVRRDVIARFFAVGAVLVLAGVWFLSQVSP